METQYYPSLLHGGRKSGDEPDCVCSKKRDGSFDAIGIVESFKEKAIADLVKDMRTTILNWREESFVTIKETLTKLERITMSVEILKETEIGRAVNGLRTHGSTEIGVISAVLVNEWMKLVDKWYLSTQCRMQDAEAEIGQKQKDHSPKCCDEADFKERLESSKRKLGQRYKDINMHKKQ